MAAAASRLSTRRRYPLMVWVYGGEDASAPSTMLAAGSRNLDVQVPSTRGFIVWRPAAPLRVGSPLQDVDAAVLPSVTHLIELGMVDPQRLAIMGNSYGGTSTLNILAQTTMFGAAITSVSGGGNPLTRYLRLSPGGQDWLHLLEGGQFRLQGTPWDNPAQYYDNRRRRSIRRYTHRCCSKWAAAIAATTWKTSRPCSLASFGARRWAC